MWWAFAISRSQPPIPFCGNGTSSCLGWMTPFSPRHHHMLWVAYIYVIPLNICITLGYILCPWGKPTLFVPFVHLTLSTLDKWYPLQYSCLENPVDGGAWFRLLSMGSQRVGHNWVTSLSFFHFTLEKRVIWSPLTPFICGGSAPGRKKKRWVILSDLLVNLTSGS